MCSGRGVGRWITHSSIRPLDSCAASQSANVRPVLGPRTVASAAFSLRDGTVQLCARKTREYATNRET